MPVQRARRRSFFSTLSSRPAVGMSLSSDGVACVALGRKRGGRVLHYAGTRKFTNGTMERGEILDGSGLVKTLSPLNHELGTQRARVAVPCEKTTIFDARVPIDADTADINAIIEFQLERLGGSAEDMAFSYEPIPFRLHSAHVPRDEEVRHTHLAVAAYPKYIHDTLARACRSAGFARPSCSVEAHSLARAVLSPQKEGTYVLVDERGGRTAVHLVVDGVVCRSLVGDASDQTSPENIARHAVDTWYARGDDDALVFEPIAGVILCGSAAHASGAREAISSALSVPTLRANVWRNVFSLEDTIPDIDAKTAQAYAIAIGLALGDAHHR